MKKMQTENEFHIKLQTLMELWILLNQELKKIHNEIEENRLSYLSQKLFNQLNYEYKNQIIELMGEMIIFQNKINRIIKELKEEGNKDE